MPARQRLVRRRRANAPALTASAIASATTNHTEAVGDADGFRSAIGVAATDGSAAPGGTAEPSLVGVPAAEDEPDASPPRGVGEPAPPPVETDDARVADGVEPALGAVAVNREAGSAAFSNEVACPARHDTLGAPSWVQLFPLIFSTATGSGLRCCGAFAAVNQ